MKKLRHIRYWLAVHTPIKLLNKEERKRLTIARFRATALLFGCNTYHLSNEKLLEKVAESSKTISRAGITVEELGKSIAMMGKAVKEKV
ncbi:hypothetical protein J0X14_14270 [Muricauda sp. CAU 1633]|uniref:hypothetical protein n=1 Tax=Allomuricauda sp. CAU 1633 TaxID=2816036 RepID=UPI001A8F79CE|nr:hypothetical protein [Muricauda sp. CAU 1633]MBO0323470.1 hypothetical protein [Muricauda sp. CAU 1633]